MTYLKISTMHDIKMKKKSGYTPDYLPVLGSQSESMSEYKFGYVMMRLTALNS